MTLNVFVYRVIDQFLQQDISSMKAEKTIPGMWLMLNRYLMVELMDKEVFYGLNNKQSNGGASGQSVN